MKKIILVLTALAFSIVSYSQVNLTLRGQISYLPETVAGVWHYVDSVGNEYALVGASDRLSIVDVTNPTAPVEVQSIPALPGQSSLWREVKTYGHYAYAGSEGGGGIIVADLSNLPGPVTYYHYYGDGAIANQIQTTHTVAVADGYLYIFGCQQVANGGAIICDLADPYNPTYVGMYDLNYVHDGYIRNDTLWAGEIYSGQFSVIDVSDKSNPILLTTQPTPGAFCHNTWLSDNSTYLFTTDELENVPLGSFDVSDINNIKLLDTYFTDSMPDQEVHNVRVLNDYLINPSYGSQLVICDGSRPSNIVEIANYPTGSFLDWDASPYLPSGNIISTDVDGGFYVFTPTYIRACYLEGNVTDSITGFPINNADIKIIGINKSTTSNLLGIYKTGTVQANTYDIEFSKAGYESKIFQGVNLSNGNLTVIDAQLVPLVITGTISNAVSGAGIGTANIYFNNGVNFVQIVADANGFFTNNTLIPGTYEVTASKWGFNSQCQTIQITESSVINFQLNIGYYDDFSGDNSWNIFTTASHGQWTRAIPVGTLVGSAISNPNVDVSGDCGNEAFVTGNLTGPSPSFDDVDNGSTQVTSPSMDLTTYNNPFVNYARWFFIPATTQAGSLDTMFVSMFDGITSKIIETITINTAQTSAWNYTNIRIKDFFPNPTNNMTITFSISDKPATDNIVEAGFDQFSISEGVSINEVKNSQIASLIVQPNPFHSTFKLVINGISDFSTTQLILSDISGRIIDVQQLKNNVFESTNFEYLTNGVYFINVRNNAGYNETLKIIKVD